MTTEEMLLNKKVVDLAEAAIESDHLLSQDTIDELLLVLRKINVELCGDHDETLKT